MQMGWLPLRKTGGPVWSQSSTVQKRFEFSSKIHSSVPSVQRRLFAAREATTAELTALLIAEMRFSLLEEKQQSEAPVPFSLTPAEVASLYSCAIQLCNDGERIEYAAAAIGIFLLIEVGMTLQDVLTLGLQQVEIQGPPVFRIFNPSLTVATEFSQSEAMHFLFDMYLGSRLAQINSTVLQIPGNKELTFLGTRRGAYSQAWFWRLLAQVWRTTGIKKPMMMSVLRSTMIRQLLRRGGRHALLLPASHLKPHTSGVVKETNRDECSPCGKLF